MRLKNGGLTGAEKVFAERFAVTNDRQYSAAEAGYNFPTQAAAKALSRPAVHAEIAKLQLARLYQEGLPLAVEMHIRILKDPATPAGAKVQALKLMYDRTLGTGDESDAKEPHEMTKQELDARILMLEAARAERAKPVLQLDPIADDADVFG